MKTCIFGATGMVGKGVLLECLEDARVESVLIIVRRASGMSHPKLREIVHPDFFDYSAIQSEFAELDACFFCLGLSSGGHEGGRKQTPATWEICGTALLFA